MSDIDKRESGDVKLDVEQLEHSTTPSVVEISEDEKRLVKKLDARIMPLACILYLFACESFQFL